MKRGKFIVIDGGEGSGKTTMNKYIREHFPDIVVTREPGGSPFAEKIRSVILSPDAKDADANTQFGLFWAARADHMKNTIIPALNSGKHVVSDRFDSSSYAYQIYGQENTHLKDLFMKVREIYLKDVVPDMYVYLDVLPEIGIKRRAVEKGYGINHFDERDIAFHERVRKGYLDFFTRVPHTVINAGNPLDVVVKDFSNLITGFLK